MESTKRLQLLSNTEVEKGLIQGTRYLFNLIISRNIVMYCVPRIHNTRFSFGHVTLRL